MSSSYQDLVLKQEYITEQLTTLERDYEKRKKYWENNLKEVNRKLRWLDQGLHVDTIARAEQVLHVAGKATDIRRGFEGHGGSVRQHAVNDAISDIANKCPKLLHEYIGVKNYQGFGDQREDHTYGMGPRHGSIVFRIALTDHGRKMLKDGEESFPYDECIYYLRNLKTIQEAE